MTKDEFKEFCAAKMTEPGKTWQEKIDAIADQWDDDTSEAWQRGVEVGQESAS